MPIMAITRLVHRLVPMNYEYARHWPCLGKQEFRLKTLTQTYMPARELCIGTWIVLNNQTATWRPWSLIFMGHTGSSIRYVG